MSGLANFEISMSPTGEFTIVLNNMDVTESVSEFSMQCKPGQPPVVSLFQVGKPGKISGEGIVRVVGPSDKTVSASEFLASVDSSRLSREVLNSTSFADDSVEIAVEILKRWAMSADAD